MTLKDWDHICQGFRQTWSEGKPKKEWAQGDLEGQVILAQPRNILNRLNPDGSLKEIER